MKLILHPGHAKCGSTTIQRFLKKNRKLLLKNKVLVPDMELRAPSEKGFKQVADSPRAFFKSVMQYGRYDDLQERLEELKRRFPDYTLVISAENLTNAIGGQDKGTKIHRMLSEAFDDVKVVYYLKSQDKYLFSAWQQWGFKTGASLKPYIDQVIAKGLPNYRQAISLFEKCYQSENLNVLFLDKACLYQGDLIKDFIYRSGLPDLKYEFSEKVENKSLNPFICEFLTSYTDLFSSIHDEKFKLFLEKYYVGDNLHERCDFVLSKEARVEILRRYSADNDYIFDNYLKDFPREKLVAGHLLKAEPEVSIPSHESIHRKLLPLIERYQPSILSRQTPLHESQRIGKCIGKVKLVCIAKDEGAYLPYWIYHHLFFGFDSIHICVNRTNDNTLKTLDRIRQHYPQVSYEIFDWVDLCIDKVKESIQHVAYAKLLSDTRNSPDFSHICFLDVDEFWISQGGELKIQDCLNALPDADCVSFEWACELGVSESFSILQLENHVEMNPLVKSVFRVDSRITMLRLHVPIFESGAKLFLADGQAFAARQKYPQQVQAHLTGLKKFAIVHRMYKSEKEYLASLLRGNPEKKNAIKLNRRGFLTSTSSGVKLGFSEPVYESYKEGYSNFLKKTAVEELVEMDCQLIAGRYQVFLDNLKLYLNQDGEKILRVLKGVKDPKVIMLIEEAGFKQEMFSASQLSTPKQCKSIVNRMISIFSKP